MADHLRADHDRSGRAVGMLSINHLQRTSPSRWAETSVAELADRGPALLIGEQQDVAHLLQQPAFVRIGRAAVIDEQGKPVGVVSLTDIERRSAQPVCLTRGASLRVSPDADTAGLPPALPN